MIGYSKQWIDEADKKAIIGAVESDFLTQGPAVTEFEEAVATYCGAKFGVAANSATSALHLACVALNLGPGDWLWTSPNTFLASSNCGLYCGANIDFVDICAKTYNISAQALEMKLQRAKQHNKLPKVLVLVHFAGQPCDLREIHELSKQYGFYIIEDAAHAIGSRYENIKIGSCFYSDITVFSFHAIKTMTTAEGGMATTNDPGLYQKMKLISSHGMTRDNCLMESESHGPWYYQMTALGYNYRLTEMQAALGISQLSKLDDFILKRNKIAEFYAKEFQNLPLVLPYQKKNIYPAWHLYVVCLKHEVKKDRKEVFVALREAGIGVNVHYIPIHIQPFYQKMGFKCGDFPVAEEYYRNCISLPMYYGLTDEQLIQVVGAVRKILS
ncbi:MAG: UDP-4-amino-4,6-dideoxy-N-acetyl-beta-L-altrosamine transaminase [Gammaproteobacteria bacterium]